MSNARRRRQTRTRRFNLPPERWPLNHNATVRAVRLARDARRHPTLTLTVKALTAFAQAAPAMVAALGKMAAAMQTAANSLTETFTAARLLDQRRAEIRRRYATLDRLALNGYDVREDMDALATEQAALELETCGITQPEALATANRAVTEFDLTSPDGNHA